MHNNNTGGTNGHVHDYTDDSATYDNREEEEQEEDYTPVKPSAKALGKRKVVESDPPSTGRECMSVSLHCNNLISQ